MMSLLLLPVLIAYSLLKIDIFLVAIADPSKSFNEAVDELFQHILGCKSMENDVNTIAICVHCLFCFKKAKFTVIIEDTICSFMEAVVELFQHTLGIDCMKHGLTTRVVNV